MAVTSKPHHRPIVEGDGYARNRYVGQPRRGAPMRTTIDGADVRLAIKELEGAHEMLARAGAEPPGIARRELHRAALGKVLLAYGFLDEVIARPEP